MAFEGARRRREAAECWVACGEWRRAAECYTQEKLLREAATQGGPTVVGFFFGTTPPNLMESNSVTIFDA